MTGKIRTLRVDKGFGFIKDDAGRYVFMNRACEEILGHRDALAVRRGLIVNVTSDAALAAYPGWGAYGASKAALELITRTLAVELRGVGVSAVVVDPGDMRTQMHQAAYPDEDISDRPLPEVTIPFWKWLLDQNPEDLRGLRLAAQRENARWLQPA